MTGLHDAARRLIAEWQPPSPGQAALREAFATLLELRPDAMQRSCAPGHLTASAVVIDPDRGVLLTLHPRIGRWVQLGGHCEPEDDSVVAAALREATEESGIEGLRIDPVPVHLDIHPLTCSGGVPTRHFDVRFAVHCPSGATEAISDESLDLKWFAPDALPDGTDGSTREAIAAAIAATS